jgi:MATE family multidrug resistance protein
MGAAGAAWGTVLAQLGGLALYLWVFWSPKLSSRYETRRWAFQPAVMWKLLTVSAPIGVQWVLETGAWTVFTAMISQWGKNELAAHHIVMQMLHLSFMPGVAISIAATTLVGQYIGARRKDLAERSGQSAIWLSGWFMGAMGVLYAVFGKQITALFNSDPHVIAIGGTLFLMAALFQIFDALSMASIGALRGAGDNQFAMWLMILASWGCFVPLIYLFGKVLGGGIVGAWWGAVAYIVLVGVVLFVRWRRGAWKSIKL